jgi:hypothetical protein
LHPTPSTLISVRESSASRRVPKHRIARSAAAKAASFADFLEVTLRAERDAQRPSPRDVCTGFPTIKALDGFDFGFAAGVPRPRIHEPRRPGLYRACRITKVTLIRLSLGRSISIDNFCGGKSTRRNRK